MSSNRDVREYQVTGKMSRDAYEINLYRGPHEETAQYYLGLAKKKYPVCRFYRNFVNGTRSYNEYRSEGK